MEVSCWDFPGQSLWKALGMLEVWDNPQDPVNNISKLAETAELWLKRSKQRLGQADREWGSELNPIGRVPTAVPGHWLCCQLPQRLSWAS